MYDGLRGPEGAALIGLANDLAVIIVATHPEDVELYENETMHAIKA